MNINKLQISAGISFLLCKIVNIGTICLIFGSFMKPSLRSFAFGSLICGIVLLVLTLILGALSYKCDKIDDLLNNPETRKLIIERLEAQNGVRYSSLY